MGLLIKVGQTKDLPALPKNWPKCGNFYLDDTYEELMSSSTRTITNKVLIYCLINLFAFKTLTF